MLGKTIRKIRWILIKWKMDSLKCVKNKSSIIIFHRFQSKKYYPIQIYPTLRHCKHCFLIVFWWKNFYLFSKTFIGKKWRAKWRRRLAQFDIGYGVRGWPGRAAGLKPGQTAISNRYSRKHWTTVLQDESINLPLNSDRNCAFAQMFARDSRFSYDREIIFAWYTATCERPVECFLIVVPG